MKIIVSFFLGFFLSGWLVYAGTTEKILNGSLIYLSFIKGFLDGYACCTEKQKLTQELIEKKAEIFFQELAKEMKNDI